MNRKRYMKGLLWLLLLAGLLGGFAAPALAQAVGINKARRTLDGIVRSGNGISSLLVYVNFTALPDISTGNLVVDAEIGDSEPELASVRLGGDTTIDVDGFPLYLEGNLGAARLSADFRVDDPMVGSTVLHPDWTIYAASGGVGVDIPVTAHWVARPVLVAGLGRISNSTDFNGPGSDDLQSALDGLITNWQTGVGFYGAAAMAEYENLNERYELNATLRLTHLEVVTLNTPSSEFDARVGTDTASLFARLGQPTPWRLSDYPLRWLLQGSGSVFLGDQSDALGFSWFSSLGIGLEADFADTNDFVSRARITLSGVVGDHVRGYSVGLGISF